MTALPILNEAEVQRISAVAALLESDHDNEALTAGRMLVRSLAKHNLRVAEVVRRALAPVPAAPVYRHDTVSPFTKHQRLARECLTGKLNAWEAGFVRDVIGKNKLTDRQREVLADIAAKVRRQRAGGL